MEGFLCNHKAFVFKIIWDPNINSFCFTPPRAAGKASPDAGGAGWERCAAVALRTSRAARPPLVLTCFLGALPP